VAARSKAWVYCCFFAGISGLNPAWRIQWMPVCHVCCEVEVSVSGWSLIQMSLTKCVCVCFFFSLSFFGGGGSSVIGCNNYLLHLTVGRLKDVRLGKERSNHSFKFHFSVIILCVACRCLGLTEWILCANQSCLTLKCDPQVAVPEGQRCMSRTQWDQWDTWTAAVCTTV
jgi:hypothetical protein